MFVEEIYRDWIIPHMAKEMMKGQEFISDLDLDDLQAVSDNLILVKAEEFKKEEVLNGRTFNETDIEDFKEKAREDFMRGGNKRFLEILKNEMKDAPLDLFINIVGKQKDLATRTDKLVKVFRQLFSTFDPVTKTFTALDDPRMAKLFNEIRENSDLSPIDFYQRPKPKQVVVPPTVSPTAPPAGGTPTRDLLNLVT